MHWLICLPGPNIYFVFALAGDDELEILSSRSPQFVSRVWTRTAFAIDSKWTAIAQVKAALLHEGAAAYGTGIKLPA
ncbi:MAG: hypothetical protein ABWY02_02610 [Telluria sp.]